MLRKTFSIRCPQGHPLTVSSFHIGLQVPCPTCQVLVVVPTPEEAAHLSSSPGQQTATRQAPSPIAAMEVAGHGLPEEDRLALARVRLGLGFFLAEIILWGVALVVLFGTAMYVGMQAAMEVQQEAEVAPKRADDPREQRGPQFPKRKPQPDPAGLAHDEKVQQRVDEQLAKLQEQLMLGMEITYCVTLALWTVGALFCLSVPAAAQARGMLLALLGCTLARATTVFVIGTLNQVQFALLGAWVVIITLVLSPALFKIYCSRLARYLGRRDLGRHFLYLMIGSYLLIGCFIAIAVMGEVAKNNNDQATQMFVGLLGLGLFFATAVWFIYYIVAFVRLRAVISQVLFR